MSKLNDAPMSTTGLTGAALMQQCERAVIGFTVAFDLGDLDRMVQLFAADGVWHRRDGAISGVDQLRQFMQVRSPTLLVRHVLSNLSTTLLSDSHAVVDSYVTVYRHDGAQGSAAPRPAPLHSPNLVGRFRDEVRRTEHGWQLSSRAVTIDFLQQSTE